LIENGEMSTKLSNLFNSNNIFTESKSYPISIYGPLFPIPTRLNYSPLLNDGIEYGSKDNFAIEMKNKSTIKNGRTLIMIGGGTGIVPFISLSQAASISKKDSNQLRFLLNVGKSSESYNSYLFNSVVNKLKQHEEDSQGRLQVKVTNERFEIQQIQEWISSNKNGTYFWICGPPAMCRDVRSKLLQVSFKSQQIFLLGVEDR